MNLRLSRAENRTLKSVNEFLGTEFEVANFFARETDGKRAWYYDRFCIIRFEEEVSYPTIGNPKDKRKEVRYNLSVEVWCPSDSRWEPDDCDYKDLGDFKNLTDAIFEAWKQMKICEYENMLANDFWAAISEWTEPEGNKQ